MLILQHSPELKAMLVFPDECLIIEEAVRRRLAGVALKQIVLSKDPVPVSI